MFTKRGKYKKHKGKAKSNKILKLHSSTTHTHKRYLKSHAGSILIQYTKIWRKQNSNLKVWLIDNKKMDKF